MTERQVFVDAARSVIGLGANPKDPEKKDSYSTLISPGESIAMAYDMLQMSGCGLVVAGIWRLSGVVSPKLDPPYIIGSAISRLTTFAHKVGAWTTFRAGIFPQSGDMVMVGDGGSGGVEHVFTVIDIAGDGYALESVDGGQRDSDGFQTVLHKRRIWKGQRDIAYMGNDPGNAIMGGRKIYGWVDVEKLPTS